ncbi:MAG TPA: hypothetical protein PKJ41_20775 [Bryobacteraceae bacterium]|nr:hypothetical protein [Bryobacteraceae bacterium]HPT26744.1 hypothetical protein [Bryobacteraceae bacterium]
MTTIETMKTAVSDVRSKPLAPLIGAAAVVVWLSLFYLWLGLPLSGFAGLAAVVVGGMLLAGALGLLAQQSLTLYRIDDGRVARLPSAGSFWLALVVFVLFGMVLPWWLIQWAPDLAGVGLQAASAALRFTLAVLLSVTGWLLVCAVVRRVMEDNGANG